MTSPATRDGGLTELFIVDILIPIYTFIEYVNRATTKGRELPSELPYSSINGERRNGITDNKYSIKDVQRRDGRWIDQWSVTSVSRHTSSQAAASTCGTVACAQNHTTRARRAHSRRAYAVQSSLRRTAAARA